jgi:hypothetical protein
VYNNSPSTYFGAEAEVVVAVPPLFITDQDRYNVSVV